MTIRNREQLFTMTSARDSCRDGTLLEAVTIDRESVMIFWGYDKKPGVREGWYAIGEFENVPENGYRYKYVDLLPYLDKESEEDHADLLSWGVWFPEEKLYGYWGDLRDDEEDYEAGMPIAYERRPR